MGSAPRCGLDGEFDIYTGMSAYIRAECQDWLPLPRNSHPHHLHVHLNGASTHRQTHVPRSRGVGTPRVIRHHGLPSLRRQWNLWGARAPGNGFSVPPSTFHATPPRIMPHIQSSTIQDWLRVNTRYVPGGTWSTLFSAHQALFLGPRAEGAEGRSPSAASLLRRSSYPFLPRLLFRAVFFCLPQYSYLLFSNEGDG